MGNQKKPTRNKEEGEEAGAGSVIMNGHIGHHVILLRLVNWM